LSTKYQRWYSALIERARFRKIPSCYTEIHHIVPRSIGGDDSPDNLAQLTYREHFIAHWILTKITTGGALRKMQRALFAMTLKCSGERVTTGWQFEAAKRAVRDLELDPEAERLWYEKWSVSRSHIGGFAKRQSRKNKRPSRRTRNINQAERQFR
jgi:hypothetical protein